jgi:hypothetical protein
MAEYRGLVSSLGRSHPLVAVVAAVLTCGSLTQAQANGKVHGQTSHRGTSWHAERDFGHGWSWDPSVGYYDGPIWGWGKGYFRCFDPVYGWHSCAHYAALAERHKWWSGVSNRRS